eukprot:15299918-Heterocapsa_arctica.AAC.1
MILEIIRHFEAQAQKLPTPCQQYLQHLKEHAANTSTPQSLEDLGHVCRISAAHQPGLSKISLSLSPHM